MSTSKTWPGGSSTVSPTTYSIPAAGEVNWASLSNFLNALGDGAQATTFQKFAVRKVVTTPTAMTTNDCVVVSDMTVASAVAVTLPAGANKQIFFIVDGKGDADTNNVTITPNGADTIAGSATLVLSGAREGVCLCYNASDTDWKIISRFNRAGSATGGFTASKVIVSDGSGNLTTATTSTTQVNYLSGATGTTGTNTTNVVYSTSPTLVTPDIGTPSAGTLTSCTGLPISTGVSGLGANVATFLATPSSANLASAVTDETGSGSLVFATSPTLVTPALGTPASGTLTSCTGLPISTGVSGLGANVATFLATPSSANLATAVTDETGSGSLVFATSPTLVTPALGTPASGTLTSCTGLPISTGVSGLGANVATFLGTPSSANLAAALTDETGSGAAVFGTAPVISSPTLAGSTASNTSRWTVPSATKATLDGLTRVEGVVVYGTDTDKLYADNGTTLVPVGSSGLGEINIIQNPNDNYATWTTTGSGPTATTTLTSGDLPLNSTVGFTTAIQLTSNTAAQTEASNHFNYAFTTPSSLGRKLKVEFWMLPGSNFIASEWTVSIYAGSTRQSLSTDSSSVSYLPSATGKFVTTFDAVASTAYTLRFARPVNAGTNAAVLNLNGIVVGPGTQPQGAVVEPWTSYSPTVSNFGTVTVATHEYRRVGESIQLRGKFATGTVVAAEASITLPTGVTITSNNNVLSGRWKRNSATGSVVKSGTLYVSGAIYFSKDDYTTASSPFVTLNGNAIAGNTENFEYMTEFLKVNEWAGSGTVNVAQNDIEYASNTSTSDAADTTSFAYGPAGSPVPGTLTAARKKRISFNNPIQATDSLLVELQPGGSGSWIPVTFQNSTDNVSNYIVQNTATYGIGIVPVSSTTVDVNFGQYAAPSGATFASAGTAWGSVTASTRYRVRKITNGQAIGFGLATQTSTGLVPNYEAYSIAIIQSYLIVNSGGGTFSSVSGTMKATKIGSMITLSFDSFAFTTASSVNGVVIQGSGALPARFRPTTNKVLGTYDVGIGGTGIFWRHTVVTDGTIVLSTRDNAGTNTAITNAAYTLNFSGSYTL